MSGGKLINLVLSGGGIKGLAYAGVFQEAEARGFRPGNIAGVSAGALAGAFAAAGFDSDELYSVINGFDFSQMDLGNIKKKVPIVERYMEFVSTFRGPGTPTVSAFVNRYLAGAGSDVRIASQSMALRGAMLGKIITYCKEGALFDGDLLEEWVSRELARRGVRTFADLKGGFKDRENPQGYKVRMTAVDAFRVKVVVLPDDISYYGIEPDRLEVAKAVRMSTCVPFAFKPVELVRKEGKSVRKHYLVDGGILDNFPLWLHNSRGLIPTVGFRIDGTGNDKPDKNDPLEILKAIISAVHDTGVPKGYYRPRYIGDIKAGKVHYLDFNLSEEEKEYLHNAGKNAGAEVFGEMQKEYLGLSRKNPLAYLLARVFAKK